MKFKCGAKIFCSSFSGENYVPKAQNLFKEPDEKNLFFPYCSQKKVPGFLDIMALTILAIRAIQIPLISIVE